MTDCVLDLPFPSTSFPFLDTSSSHPSFVILAKAGIQPPQSVSPGLKKSWLKGFIGEDPTKNSGQITRKAIPGITAADLLPAIASPLIPVGLIPKNTQESLCQAAWISFLEYITGLTDHLRDAATR